MALEVFLSGVRYPAIWMECPGRDHLPRTPYLTLAQTMTTEQTPLHTTFRVPSSLLTELEIAGLRMVGRFEVDEESGLGWGHLLGKELHAMLEMRMGLLTENKRLQDLIQPPRAPNCRCSWSPHFPRPSFPRRVWKRVKQFLCWLVCNHVATVDARGNRCSDYCAWCDAKLPK